MSKKEYWKETGYNDQCWGYPIAEFAWKDDERYPHYPSKYQQIYNAGRRKAYDEGKSFKGEKPYIESLIEETPNTTMSRKWFKIIWNDIKSYTKQNLVRVCMWVALVYFVILSYSDAYITNVYKREKIQLETKYNYLLEKQKKAYETIVDLNKKIVELENQN